MDSTKGFRQRTTRDAPTPPSPGRQRTAGGSEARRCPPGGVPREEVERGKYPGRHLLLFPPIRHEVTIKRTCHNWAVGKHTDKGLETLRWVKVELYIKTSVGFFMGAFCGMFLRVYLREQSEMSSSRFICCWVGSVLRRTKWSAGCFIQSRGAQPPVQTQQQGFKLIVEHARSRNLCTHPLNFLYYYHAS